MKLYIAGILHQDPLGRTRLNSWIDGVNRETTTPPTFIAIEWDKEILKEVISQRSALESLVKAEWPSAPTAFIKEMVLAIGFEAEIPIHRFPGAPIIYLDEGREVDDPTKISEYARDRMNNYRTMYDEEIGGFGEDQLQSMSRYCWSTVECTSPKDRDRLFANRILAKVQHLESNWAIAVTGACHAEPLDGFMCGILVDEGLDCLSSRLDVNWAP